MITTSIDIAGLYGERVVLTPEQLDDLDTRIRATYGANFDRLTRIKATYDPDNLFRMNRNIRPAA